MNTKEEALSYVKKNRTKVLIPDPIKRFALGLMVFDNPLSKYTIHYNIHN